MIFKKRLQSKFTAISNDICVNAALSTDARWCLWYLLTKPVDWVVRPKDIQATSGWGKEKAYKVVKELVTANYLVVSQAREEGGQFGAISYDVYEEPFTGSPLPENPDTVNRDTENQSLTKDLKKPKTDKVQKTELDISFDQDFAEFWAAYPKRPNNSRVAAKKKYIAARRRNVSHETIMAGVKAYAATRNEAVAKGDNPHFTQMAETWLNKAGWENDYSLPSGVATKLEPATVDDETIDQVIAQYPGVVSNRAEAKRVLAAEIAKGVKVAAIVEAALKYKLYARDMKAVDKPISPPILETWIRFKWREMDAYVLKRDPLNGKYKIRAAKK